MKFTKIFISLIFIGLAFFCSAENDLEFNIHFGRYENDHYKKEFRYNKRTWNLVNSQLTYSFESNNKTHIDTLILKDSSIISIHDFITKNKLNKSILKDLSESKFKKRQVDLRISGYLKTQNQNNNFDIKANSLSILSMDLDANKFYKLEDIFYKMIKLYNK